MEIDKILENRQNEYGDPEENFRKIGIVWSLILKRKEPIEPYQVALMMDSLKTVRLIENPNHIDSWLDKMGYSIHGKKIIEDNMIKYCSCGKLKVIGQKCDICYKIINGKNPA